MKITQKQLRQIIREELIREGESGDDSSYVGWWETTPEEEEQIRQAEEAAFMRSPLVRTMHRARIFLDPHEIKDLIKRAGTQNPEKVIALYRSDLERARRPSAAGVEPDPTPTEPEYSEAVAERIKYYTTTTIGRQAWRTGGSDEYADMAQGGDGGWGGEDLSLRDQYYPDWSDDDFKTVLDAVNKRLRFRE